MFDCPDCRASFDTLEGAAMHYLNKESGHSEYQSKRDVKDAIRGEADSSPESTEDMSESTERKSAPFDSVESGSSSDGSEESTEGDDSDDSLIPLEPGREVWVRNDARQVGKLSAEEGDVLDVDREVLIEKDGTEWDIAGSADE